MVVLESFVWWVWFDFVYLISWVWVVFDRFAMGLTVGWPFGGLRWWVTFRGVV